jgi:hypothetical protein
MVITRFYVKGRQKRKEHGERKERKEMEERKREEEMKEGSSRSSIILGNKSSNFGEEDIFGCSKLVEGSDLEGVILLVLLVSDPAHSHSSQQNFHFRLFHFHCRLFHFLSLHLLAIIYSFFQPIIKFQSHNILVI